MKYFVDRVLLLCIGFALSLGHGSDPPTSVGESYLLHVGTGGPYNQLDGVLNAVLLARSQNFTVVLPFIKEHGSAKEQLATDSFGEQEHPSGRWYPEIFDVERLGKHVKVISMGDLVGGGWDGSISWLIRTHVDYTLLRSFSSAIDKMTLSFDHRDGTRRDLKLDMTHAQTYVRTVKDHHNPSLIRPPPPPPGTFQVMLSTLLNGFVDTSDIYSFQEGRKALMTMEVTPSELLCRNQQRVPITDAGMDIRGCSEPPTVGHVDTELLSDWTRANTEALALSPRLKEWTRAFQAWLATRVPPTASRPDPKYLSLAAEIPEGLGPFGELHDASSESDFKYIAVHIRSGHDKCATLWGQPDFHFNMTSEQKVTYDEVCPFTAVSFVRTMLRVVKELSAKLDVEAVMLMARPDMIRSLKQLAESIDLTVHTTSDFLREQPPATPMTPLDLVVSESALCAEAYAFVGRRKSTIARASMTLRAARRMAPLRNIIMEPTKRYRRLEDEAAAAE